MATGRHAFELMRLLMLLRLPALCHRQLINAHARALKLAVLALPHSHPPGSRLGVLICCHHAAQVFADLGILTPSEVHEVISIEFNPVRIALAGSAEIETRDILNCGVSPRKVLEFVKRRFLNNGGWGQFVLSWMFRSQELLARHRH